MPDNIVHHVNVVLIVPSVGRNGNIRIIERDIPYAKRRRSCRNDLKKERKKMLIELFINDLNFELSWDPPRSTLKKITKTVVYNSDVIL